MCKFVTLKLFCSNAPCQITIYNDNNQVIKTCTVNTCCATINVCTAGCTLRILAQYQAQTIYRLISLGCCFCQTICTSFIFTPLTTVNVTLTDRNYGFPILNANLNFQANQ